MGTQFGFYYLVNNTVVCIILNSWGGDRVRYVCKKRRGVPSVSSERFWV